MANRDDVEKYVNRKNTELNRKKRKKKKKHPILKAILIIILVLIIAGVGLAVGFVQSVLNGTDGLIY